MIPHIRSHYNQDFTEKKYRDFIDELANLHPGQLDFRVAETPVFIPVDFTTKMLAACEHIVDVISKPDYKLQSDKAIPPSLYVPKEDQHTALSRLRLWYMFK